jgi:hypothetical protein
MKLSIITTILIAATPFACSSPPGPGASTTATDASPSANTAAGVLEAPPAGHGVQYQMSTSIAPSEEDERCKFVLVPPGGLWVNREEVRYNGGSHHFILWKSSYTAIPTLDLRGNTVDTSDVFECPGGPSGTWSATAFAAGAQSGDGQRLIDGLPSDTAVRFDPGSVLIMDLHVLNPSDQQVRTEVRINLWTVPDDQVTTEAGVYFFYNPFIRVPAGGSATARMSCPVTSNVQLVNAQTHMHRRGLGGSANLLDSSGNLIQEIYQSHSWEAVNVQSWTPGMTLQSGQSIDYKCNYQSSEPVDVMQGPTTKDEMCVLFGLYYPRDPKFETCSADGTWAGLSSAATFIGSGTATCMDTMQCVSQAAPQEQDHGDSLFGCIVASCPKAAVEVTASVGCSRSQRTGSCQAQCSGSGGTSCTQCIQQNCQKELDACASATCQ